MHVRIHILVEGQTEELFVRDCLAPHLGAMGLDARCSILKTSRSQRGGLVSFEQQRGQVKRLLLQDRGIWVTTLFDFYGLPSDFPRLQVAKDQPSPDKKAAIIEQAMKEYLESQVHPQALDRFLPHVSMHEFEGLLFSDPERIAERMQDPGALERLNTIRGEVESPEHIDDGPATAPSKRLAAVFPRYDKRLDGPAIVASTGLDTIRRECPLFDAWLTRLEALEPLEG